MSFLTGTLIGLFIGLPATLVFTVFFGSFFPLILTLTMGPSSDSSIILNVSFVSENFLCNPSSTERLRSTVSYFWRVFDLPRAVPERLKLGCSSLKESIFANVL